MAKCVTAGPGASPGNGQNDGNEVNGLVERVAPHLTNRECQQLPAPVCNRKGRSWTDRHRTAPNTHGQQPAIKQRVQRYPAACWEEKRQFVEDMCGAVRPSW